MKFFHRLIRKTRPDPIPEIARVAGQILYLSAEQIMTESRTLVPVVTGNLRASANVQPPKISGTTVTVELGYGGPAATYALSVHENPRAGKTGGVSPSGHKYAARRWSQVGQWKYLEQPFNDAKPRIHARLRRALIERIR